MEEEANTTFYKGFRLELEPYASILAYCVTGQREGQTTVSGYGDTIAEATRDAKRRIDAITERDMGS